MDNHRKVFFIFSLLIGLAAVSAYLVAMYQASTYRSSASENIPPPSENVCGKECTSDGDCGGGFVCGKVCTSGKCPPQSKTYCHNPSCPNKTFVTDYRTTYTLWTKNINSDNREDIEKECTSMSTMTQPQVVEVFSGDSYEEASQKCQDHGTSTGHPYCKLVPFNFDDKTSGSCYCQSKPFGSGRICQLNTSAGYLGACECFGDRSLESMTSCNCSPSLKTPICRGNELAETVSPKIEYGEYKVGDQENSTEKGAGGCSENVTKITCSDGQEFTNLRPPCINPQWEKDGLCYPGDPGSYPPPSDPSENRWCATDKHWEELAYTICNAPKLQKSQCIGMRSQAISKESCDSICGQLHGKQCQRNEGSSVYDYRCCPDGPEIDDVWTWALYTFPDKLEFMNPNLMPAVCFKPTPTPRQQTIDPVVPGIRTDDDSQNPRNDGNTPNLNQNDSFDRSLDNNSNLQNEL